MPALMLTPPVKVLDVVRAKTPPAPALVRGPVPLMFVWVVPVPPLTVVVPPVLVIDTVSAWPATLADRVVVPVKEIGFAPAKVIELLLSVKALGRITPPPTVVWRVPLARFSVLALGKTLGAAKVSVAPA